MAERRCLVCDDNPATIGDRCSPCVAAHERYSALPPDQLDRMEQQARVKMRRVQVARVGWTAWLTLVRQYREEQRLLRGK